MFKMIDHWKHLSRLVSTPRWALKLRCIQKKFYSYFEKKGVYYSIVELHFLTMTTFIYTKWEQGQLNLHIFKKTFVHPLVNDQVKVHWALKNAVRILKKNSENDGCQIWRKVVQKQLPIIINGFIFRDYLVKIKTKGSNRVTIIYLSSWTKDSLSHIIWEEEEEWLFCCHIWTSASHLCKMSYVEPYFA